MQTELMGTASPNVPGNRRSCEPIAENWKSRHDKSLLTSFTFLAWDCPDGDQTLAVNRIVDSFAFASKKRVKNGQSVFSTHLVISPKEISNRIDLLPHRRSIERGIQERPLKRVAECFRQPFFGKAVIGFFVQSEPLEFRLCINSQY